MNNEIFNAITSAIKERRMESRNVAYRKVLQLAGDLAQVFAASDGSFNVRGFYSACGMNDDDIAMINDHSKALTVEQLKVITASTRHQGYKNYETFTVAFTLNNDQNTQREARAIAHRSARFDKEMGDVLAANAIRAWVEKSKLTESGEDAEEVLQGIGSTLLNAAMGDVDWLEIAREFLRMEK